MKKIEIDLDVWKTIQNDLRDLNETENDALRRLLKIDTYQTNSSQKGEEKMINQESAEFEISKLGIAKAKGKWLPGNRFLVYEGSTIANREDNYLPDTYKNLKVTLIAENYIEGSVFKKNYQFSSSSSAASIILGGSRNGLKEWKNSDGLSIKEYLQKKQNQ